MTIPDGLLRTRIAILEAEIKRLRAELELYRQREKRDDLRQEIQNSGDC